MPHDVFISYSSHDKVIADAICSKLENNNIRCWIAPRDILPGIEYGESIIDAIAGCQISVLIFSATANDSPQVRREIERAVSKGKIIIPFRIEDVLPTKSMEYALSSTHWLDAMTPPLESHIFKLDETVHRLLNKQPKINKLESLHEDSIPSDKKKIEDLNHYKEFKSDENTLSPKKQITSTESIKEALNIASTEKKGIFTSLTTKKEADKEKNTIISGLKTITNKKDGTQLVLIKEGEFLAGGPDKDLGGGPPFPVSLPSFYLAKYPVTNEQFARFLTESKPELKVLTNWIWLDQGCYVRKSGGGYEPYGGKNDHPVINVRWQGAHAYSEWAGLRLPTELEWEKGARGIDGRKFPWGDKWDKNKCRYSENKGNETTCSVMSYPEGISPWGLFQMLGNVDEWVADWCDPLAYERYWTGDLSAPQGKSRMLRGGSWRAVTYHGQFDCAHRTPSDYNFEDHERGFRCAKNQ